MCINSAIFFAQNLSECKECELLRLVLSSLPLLCFEAQPKIVNVIFVDYISLFTNILFIL